MCPLGKEVAGGVSSRPQPKSQCTSTLATQSLAKDVFLQVVKVQVQGEDGERTVQALIDTGSQYSYILDEVARDLGCEIVGKKTLQHALFGGVKSGINEHDCFRVKTKSVYNVNNHKTKFLNNEKLELIMIGSTKICEYSPKLDIRKIKIDVENIGVNINNFVFQDKPIEMLFGADIAGRLFTGKLRQLDSGLTAIETIFGWTIMGTRKTMKESFDESLAVTLHSGVLKNSDIANLWKLDVLGVEEPSVKYEREAKMKETLRHFEDTVIFNEEGRYEVKLPWIEDAGILPSYFKMAYRRLLSTTKKLLSTSNFDRYDQVFKEWVDEELIEVVPKEELEIEKVHYLAHRAVIKESSLTTKVRPVFDASAREKNSPSLNSCLDKGPNLVELIPNGLLRFRRGRFAVSSDVRKAFQQISVNKEDREYLRFLWWEDWRKKKIKVFRHRRVVFGVTCSPFQLQAVIQHHLERIIRDKTVDSSQKSTANILLKSFYVDNSLASLDSKEELEVFVLNARAIMKMGGFELRCWEYSENIESFPSETEEISSKVLGLNWDRVEDSLGVQLPVEDVNCSKKLTKRRLLSTVHRVFDPIGITSPALLTLKLMLREVYSSKIDWDSEVDSKVSLRYNRWMAEFPVLSKIRIPRWLQMEAGNRSELQIHTFVDASKDAYGAVAYLRCVTAGDVKVTLVEAKSRLAPVNNMTIPRLELMAALIGARLTNTVMEELGMEIDVCYWTDSTTVLAWIQRSETWKTFVGNRVKEIRKLTDVERWRHVPGNANQADLLSRGCSPTKLLQSNWWKGPAWLYQVPKMWPAATTVTDEVAIEKERKLVAIRTALSTLNAMCEWCGQGRSKEKACCQYNGKRWFCRYFSKYNNIVNLVAYVLRFTRNCRQPTNRRSGGLTADEVKDAERRLIKFLQDECFQGSDVKKIHQLQPFRDNDGIFRMKSRIYERADDVDFRCPYILPADHDVVTALIMSWHVRLCHAGTQILLAALREKFWIVGGRRAVRKVVSACTICRRHNAKAIICDSPPLPRDRVEDSCPFRVTGIDFAGPLYLKGNQKAWVVLFTCAVVRAVHLEVVTSLSTVEFLQTFRRFVARRGRPEVVYSDNGTNFVGAARALKGVNWEKIAKYASEERIVWKFNPPTASWWGGWWERLVGLVKQLLRKVLGKACLSYEEMLTTLCDVEATVNGRPLTYLSEDPLDLVPLTPNSFLRGETASGMPDCDLIDAKSLNKRLRFCQKIKEDLRGRFRREYLGQLVQKRRKGKELKTKTVQVGDVVIVDANTKRIDWPLAIVEEVIPGRDGKVRLVQLRTKGGLLKRPVQRVYPLEVQHVTETPADPGTDGDVDEG